MIQENGHLVEKNNYKHNVSTYTNYCTCHLILRESSRILEILIQKRDLKNLLAFPVQLTLKPRPSFQPVQNEFRCQVAISVGILRQN